MGLPVEFWQSVEYVIGGWICIAAAVGCGWVILQDRPQSGYYNTEAGRRRRRRANRLDFRTLHILFYLVAGIALTGLTLLAKGYGYIR